MDLPCSPTESDTDTPASDQSSDTSLTSNTECLAEDMDLDESNGGEHHSGNLQVFQQDKSFEELRAETLSDSSNIQENPDSGESPNLSNLELSNIEENNLLNTNGASSSSIQNAICDTNNTYVNSESSVEASSDHSHDNTCNNRSCTADREFEADSGITMPLEKETSSETNIPVDNVSSSDSQNSECSEKGGPVPSTNVDNTFNNFQYWRPPLPQVDIDLDIINSQPANIHIVSKVHKKELAARSQSKNESYSISGHLTDSLNQLELGTGSYYSSSVDRKGGCRIHTASVNTVSDAADETVSNIGSTHVLGQLFGEQHMAVVDGVVQGRH